MMHPNPHLLLMGALRFSALDLHMNRQGQLSTAQCKQLEERRLFHTGFSLVALLMLWGVGLLLQAEFLLLLFISAAVGSVGIGLWQRTTQDLREQVETLSGRLAVAPNWFPFVTTLQIGAEPLPVSRDISAAFQPGQLYRAYVTAGSQTLLSAELVA